MVGLFLKGWGGRIFEESVQAIGLASRYVMRPPGGRISGRNSDAGQTPNLPRPPSQATLPLTHGRALFHRSSGYISDTYALVTRLRRWYVMSPPCGDADGDIGPLDTQVALHQNLPILAKNCPRSGIIFLPSN